MTWKLLALGGGAIAVVAFVLGIIPIRDGRCGSSLFPAAWGSNEQITYIDGLENPLKSYCYEQPGWGYWIAIALGIVILVAALIVRNRSASDSGSASE